MTEEERAKADAAAGEKLDKMLSCLDAISSRMDALEAADKARKDAEDADKKEREDKARKDAEEAGKTDPEPVAADKRKDAEDEAEKKAKEDKARKDAEEREEAEKADRARKDSEMAQRIKDLESRLPKARSDADYAALADAQARADDVYQSFGDSAPGPLHGETLGDYNRRLASGLKRHSAKWKGEDLYALPDSVAEIAREAIFADAAAAALAPPEDLAHGQFLEVVKPNRLTGGRIIEFRGRGTFIGAMKRPAMRVARIEARKAN